MPQYRVQYGQPKLPKPVKRTAVITKTIWATRRFQTMMNISRRKHASLLSARKSYANYIHGIQRLCHELLANVDTEAVTQMEKNFCNEGMSLPEFVDMFQRYLNQRRIIVGAVDQGELYATQLQIAEALVELFESIDLDGNRFLSFDELLETILMFGMKKAEQRSIGPVVEPYEKTNTFTPTSSRDVDRSIMYIAAIDRVLWHESGSPVLREFDPATMELLRKRRIQESDLSTMIYIGSSSGGIVYNLLLVASTNYIASYDYSTVLDELRLVERVLTSSPVTAFLYDPLEDLLYYGMRSGRIRTWSLYHPKTLVRDHKTIVCFEGHSDVVTSLTSIDGAELLCSTSLDGTIRLWDLDSFVEKRCYRGHKRGVVGAIFSAEFRIVLSASLDKRILGWSPFSDQVVFQLESHTSPILSMQHIPGRQQLITADTGGIVKVWDQRSFTCVQSICTEPTLQHVTPLSKRHDRILLTNSGSTTHCLDMIGNQYNPKMFSNDEVMTRCVLNTNNLTIVGSIQRSLLVWSALTGELQRTMKDIVDSDITALEFDERKRKICIGVNSGRLLIFNYESGSLMRELSPHTDEVNLLHWCASDGTSTAESLLMSASIDGHILIHNEASGALLFDEFYSGSSLISCCSLECSGARVAFADHRGDIQICNTTIGMSDFTITASNRSPVLALCFLDTTGFVVASNERGISNVYHISSTSKSACSAASLAPCSGGGGALSCFAYDRVSHHLYGGNSSGWIYMFDLSDIVQNNISDENSVVPCLRRFYIAADAITSLSVLEDPETLLVTWFDSISTISIRPSLELCRYACYALLVSTSGAIVGELRAHTDTAEHKWNYDVNVEQHKAARRTRARQVLHEAKSGADAASPNSSNPTPFAAPDTISSTPTTMMTTTKSDPTLKELESIVRNRRTARRQARGK